MFYNRSSLSHFFNKKVYSAVNDRGEKIAVKTRRPLKSEKIEFIAKTLFKGELETLSLMSHPNIVG